MSKSQKKVQIYEFDLEIVEEFFNSLLLKDPVAVNFWLDAKMNPDVEAITGEAAGKTALSYVISRWTDSPRDAEVLKLLLEHGANPNIMIDVTNAVSGMVVNKTLLSWLVEQNNTDLVKTALECGANPNTINNPTEAPALHRRAIDGVIDSPQTTTIVGLLRNYGSVEPKNPVLSGGLLPKLEPVVGYSPDTYVNMTRAGAIVAKMIADHPLDDIQITAKIIAFKTMLARDYGGILNFAVRVDGVGISLSDVIDGLLEGYEGRFAAYSINDIRKTVGTIIHISENNAELIGGLAAKLAEVNMCNFSKLIELLYVVQDPIIGGGQIAWHTKNIDDFQVVFDRVFDKLSKDVEDPELAFVQWFLDMYKGNRLKPEDRHPLTNKISGMFNEVFSEIVTASEVARGINGVLASYHFSDGLQQKVADLVQKLVQSDIGEHKFLAKWMELYNVSQSTALQQFFDQAKDVNEDEVKDFFDNLAYSTPYMNTFEFVGFQMIREAYVKVLNSKPYSYAKEFIKAVARLEFDNVVKKDVEKLAEVVSKFSNKEMLLASKEWQRLDIMIDSQKLEFITKTSLYTNDQISLLLTKAVPNAYVAPIIDLTADGNIWENILLQSIIGVTHDNKSSILIPINLNNVHWSGMIIKPKIGGGYQVIYNDPMGVALTARAGGRELINKVKDVFAVHAVTDLLFKQQFNDKDCGVFVVDNLTKLAARKTARLSAEGLKVLLSKGNQSAQNLRKDHDVALGLKALEQAVKILQEAVSLKNKGEMAFVLEETERPKDIESIRELSVIKRSYELALGKGPSFTKAFLRAMERFNFDSPEIAQGFIELKAIAKKYKTEVLESVEWKSIGTKPGAAGIEFLESVVSKGKAEMLTELTSNAHLKVVEELSSISPFKKACERSLEKGLVYTKKFIGALQKNYSFDPKVAQDLAKLGKIVEKYKTAAEVLESVEWKSIGAKPRAAGIEFLESVVSKGKAEMLTELTSNAHLKVVEELSSISPFKKACERSLEKGLVYTKKFIGALQKNYSFDPKITQDLNELSKIVVSHNTFSELVESEEWIKIGGDTGSINDYDF